MRLYDLTDQYNDLLEMLESDPDNEALQAMLDGLEGKIDEKVESIIKVVKTLEYEAKALGDEIRRLQDRKASVEANRKRLLEYTENLLTEAGLDKLKGKLFTVWIQNNPPSVNVVDESLIPKEYFVFKQELQKKAILEAWKEGVDIPGVEIQQGRGLRVK